MSEAEAVKVARMTASEAHTRARQLAAEKELALVRAEADAVRLESTAIAAHREAAGLVDELQVMQSAGTGVHDPTWLSALQEDIRIAKAQSERSRQEAVAAREMVKRVRAERDSELLAAVSRAKAAAEAAIALELARIKAAESAARIRAQLAELDKDDAVIAARVAAASAKRHLESVTAKLRKEKSEAVAKTLEVRFSHIECGYNAVAFSGLYLLIF